MGAPLWTASKEELENSQLAQFLNYLKKEDLSFGDYNELHSWSVKKPGDFWTSLINFYDVKYEGSLEPAHKELSFLDYPWFPNLKLNFAENLLKNTATRINCQFETRSKIKISYKELYQQVANLQDFLKPVLNEGDVLAAYMPNIAETVVAMLATSSIGAIFTSTSPDFGVQGVIDRFGQTKPKVLISVTGYSYNGKYFDLTEKIKEIREKIPSIEQVILVDFLEQESQLDGATDWNEIQESAYSEITFASLPFNHPLYIMYSSGTTGKPKCIVHSAGGTLLQHIKEQGLHTNLTSDKTITYFTTCGWMMWNWLVSSLYFGPELLLYEGSPSYPSIEEFFHIIDREKINIFGTSPKFLSALEHAGFVNESGFDSLNTILSTGSPLNPEQFDFVYENIKSNVHLSSICGGTDLIGCFMLGNPNLEVHRGEIQSLGLAMDVACFDEFGKEIINKEGELVCKTPFPSQPIGFWNDDDKSLFKKAYFEKYPGIWHHGDFITITERKSVLVAGRSDATLNPGGIRIGTAEIYRQTEKLEYILDSICVGKKHEGDTLVALFVKMKDDKKLTEDHILEIKQTIKLNTTPRHTPQIVRQVKDIPYTRSSKKMELAISRIINGKPITNIEAVSNPECLKEYELLDLN